jgi:hypothetical protein
MPAKCIYVFDMFLAAKTAVVFVNSVDEFIFVIEKYKVESLNNSN